MARGWGNIFFHRITAMTAISAAVTMVSSQVCSRRMEKPPPVFCTYSSSTSPGISGADS